MQWVFRVLVIALMAGVGMSGSDVFAAEVISAKQAQAMARSGEALLIDIRTPEEWRESGVGTEAHAITMHQTAEGFWQQIEAVTGGDKAKPLALICRTGNRTNYMQQVMAQAGYTRVLDVGEGMMGSSHGPGWVKAGLGVRSGAVAQSTPPVLGPAAKVQ